MKIETLKHEENFNEENIKNVRKMLSEEEFFGQIIRPIISNEGSTEVLVTEENRKSCAKSLLLKR